MADVFSFFKTVATNRHHLIPTHVFSATTRRPFVPVSAPFSSLGFSKNNNSFIYQKVINHNNDNNNNNRVMMNNIPRASFSAGSAKGNGVVESINAKINSSPVVVYSKSWCPYCEQVKSLFQDLGVKADVVELDELGESERQVQNALQDLTGQSTVPNVFIGGKHIGGCTDTMELYQNGELKGLLSSASIKESS